MVEEHGALMNRIYRHQRYIYDFTRKYFLLGRDRILREMVMEENSSVLEIGCGTGRNLAKLARKRRDLNLYGLDASSVMLDTAGRKLGDRAVLRHALAGDFSPAETFGREEKFDTILFSYTLSMIPDWQGSLDNALRHLADDGRLYIVDFWDQEGLPRTFRRLLTWWLRIFHVIYRPELIERLEHLGENDVTGVNIQSIAGRYAFVASISKVLPAD